MVSELAQKVINKKPYLETKFITYAKSENQDKMELFYTNFPLSNGKYECKENLDRIKLPCYCTFEWRGKRRLGILHNDGHRKYSGESTGSEIYSLTEIDKQTNNKIGDLIQTSYSLAFLIEYYKINIGKVKLTYYETI